MLLPASIAAYVPPEVIPALNDECDRLRAQQSMLRGMENSITLL